MKAALILDDDEDSTIILHLLLKHKGYQVRVNRYMQECIRLLSYTSIPNVVFLGTSIEALATLIGVAEEPALQQHIYIHMVERGQRVPRFARQAISQQYLLTLPKPLDIPVTLTTMMFAEELIEQMATRT